MEKNEQKEKLFTLSEFRREVGIPLIVAKKLIIWGEVEATKAVDGTFQIAESEVFKIKEFIKHPWNKAKIFFKALGPGLITGASDDDPSGIGTYSSVGAKFGLAILWTAFWLLPIMLAVQEVCARIGVITNKGLVGVLKKHYKKKIVAGIVVFLIIANVINIGADLGAMAASLNLLSGLNFYLGAIAFAIFIILIEVFVEYNLYAKILKWLALSVLSYVVAGFFINPEWTTVFKNAFIPQIDFNKDYLFALIAVFGTTITPYLFFWQASEEVEENKMLKSNFSKEKMRDRIARMRTDVKTGMILANIVFFFIIVTTAQVLFKNGITNINSAQDAAMALRPFAGDFAYLLFALGIIGTGLLAVPVLAGSGAYAISELMKWKEGLDLKFSRAKGFYLIITLSILFGLAFNFLNINPIAALYYSAFVNGIIAVPLLVAIMVVGNDKKIMGAETHPFWVKIFGWFGVVAMISAVITMIILYII
ncbi:MAG: divalent metal cation transporter [Patescibacteria group bacterium]